jgi:hypothetical protein
VNDGAALRFQGVGQTTDGHGVEGVYLRLHVKPVLKAMT